MSEDSHKKAYLFVHDNQVGDRRAVRKMLDQMPLIETWRYDMPNVFYLVARATADELAAEFEDRKGNDGLYVFLEYLPSSQGRLTGDTWYLLNNLKHPERRQAK